MKCIVNRYLIVFVSYLNLSVILLDTLPKCGDISESYIKPVVDSILIIDGSRDEFQNLQLISCVFFYFIHFMLEEIIRTLLNYSVLLLRPQISLLMGHI